MTAIPCIIGPADFAQPLAFSAGSGWSTRLLNDADNAVATIFSLPKTGNITKVGFWAKSWNGTPPAYNVGLTTLSSGVPTQTSYGGSSPGSYTFTAAQWEWVTLATPSSGSAGDIVAAHIWPGGTPPDGSNYVSVAVQALYTTTLPYGRNYTTSWLAAASGPYSMAIQYDDNSIYGFPITDWAGVAIGTGTTPDEMGNKFQVPLNLTVAGGVFHYYTSTAGSEFDLILYDAGDTILASKHVASTNISTTRQVHCYFDSPVSLDAGTDYRLVIKPTTAATVTFHGYSFVSSTDRQTKSIPFSNAWMETERTDGGSWTDTNTKIMTMALIVSDITAGEGDTVALPAYMGFVG